MCFAQKQASFHVNGQGMPNLNMRFQFRGLTRRSVC